MKMKMKKMRMSRTPALPADLPQPTTTMDFAQLVSRKTDRFRELDAEVSAGSIYDDPRRAREILREHMRLKELLGDWDELQKARAELAENQEMAKATDELAEMAQAEIPALEEQIAALQRRIQYSLLPPDPNEDRDAILEIRAGTGGDEAGIFAGDLYRMYTRYAEIAGLKIEPMESSPADIGGFREVIFRVSGEGVFRKLRYESGVHRVQRVPATEAQGRIHTSTATVAVLPEAEEVDLELKPDEIRIEVCRAGGPGGQGVNTTDSAVQVMHIPTGTIVRCQDGRSQQKNKEKALKILRSRLLERKQHEEAEKYAAHRKDQIGTGERSEKVRTYNYPQNRVTDHRVDLTLYNLDSFVEGNIQQMIDTLQKADMEARLAAAGAA
jgi:peptide chain release factor 1